MFEMLRNILRRKMRMGLTVAGIAIGILTLTVMGSMSEYFNTLMENALLQAKTEIGISPKGGLRPQLSEIDLRRVQRVPGVHAVVPFVVDFLGDPSGAQGLVPDVVIGQPPDLVQLGLRDEKLLTGRWLQRGDMYVAVVGRQLAAKKNLGLGGIVRWRNHDFTVVGITVETQTSDDSTMVIPLDVTRRLLKQPNLITTMSAIPEDPGEVEALAQRIREAVDTVTVQSPQDAVNAIRQQLMVFNAILLSGAFLAVIVGAVAVINTMVMSVSERTKEIGLKKAIGASDGHIIREYVLEAAFIGLIGGLVGLILGSLFAGLLNQMLSQPLGGTSLFTITPRLVLTALLFAVGLSTGAGLYPAWSAARLDPVKALRSE